MKFPKKDNPMWCGFTEMQLNMRVGELRKYVPESNKAPKPAYLLTRMQFLEQIKKPLYSVDLDKGVQNFKLQRHVNRIHAALSLKCKEFTRNIQHLPGTHDMACIELVKEQHDPVYVCFSLSNLYCRGVYTSEVFYENIDISCPTNLTNSGFLVEGSMPLGLLGHSYSKLGIKLPFEVTGQKFLNSFIAMASLGTENKDLEGALYGLGMFALLFMEPVRQLVVQNFFQPGKNKLADEYGTLTEDGDVMKAIRDWGKDSLTAQGLKKETDHVLREDPEVDYGKRVAALANIKTINHAGILYYFSVLTSGVGWGISLPIFSRRRLNLSFVVSCQCGFGVCI